MKNYIIFSLILGMMLFGCIGTEVKHVQYADGSADISQSTDISLFASEEYASIFSAVFDTLCDSYSSEVDCEEEGGVVTLSKKFSASEAFYTFEVKEELIFKKYRLTVDELPAFDQYSTESDYGGIFGDSYSDSYTSPYSPTTSGGYGDYLNTETPTELSSAKAKAVGKAMESMGMDYTYKIKMPGRIIEAEGAVKFNDSMAEFDVVEMLQEKKPIVVVSEELNWLILLLLLGLVAFGILIAVIFFIRSAQPHAEMPRSDMETRPKQPAVDMPQRGVEQ